MSSISQETSIAQGLSPDSDAPPQLVVHTKRPGWGVALLTAQNHNRRRYQFQDGGLRSFKSGYYHLLENYEASDTVMEMLFEELRQKHGESLEEKKIRERFKPKPPVMKFAEQVQVFLSLYPKGFQDPEYLHLHRCRPDGRNTKSLIEPVQELARELLAEPKLKAHIEAEEYAEVHRLAGEVFDATSEASPTKVVRPFRSMKPQAYERFAKALYRLLHESGDYSERFREWLMALDAGGTIAVSWAMATLIPMLMSPKKHCCVRRRVFRLQARLLMPHRPLRKFPSPAAYKRYRKVAVKVRKLLQEEGLKPKDMFDVYQFIWETLRPKGQQQLKALQGDA